MTAADVLAALADFQDPETGRNAVQQQQIRDVEVSGNDVRLTLALTSHSAPLKSETAQEVEKQLRAKLPGIGAVEVRHAEHDRPPLPLGEIGLMAKSVIAVGSGKGGVGKSTIASGIAYGLLRAGCKVGLLDADIYGPSIPHLLGLRGKAELTEQKKIQPHELEGLKVMSIGFMVEPDQPVILRGPMLHGAIHQMLRDTAWGPLDYLIIDMPPGTGDIALSLSQILPLTGAVVVCTPQDVALLDAVKAVAMFRRVNIPVLGMVENMSYFLCPDNGKRYDIFGTGGAKRKAEELKVPFLGEVPINIQIRVNGDEGKIAGNFSNAETAPHFEGVVAALARQLRETMRTNRPLPTLSILK
ncbi:MAG: Mrp/NBP35 family ATP-binding protein [Planctomycetes bacterium]|nr:Mrp/NBP35 family ATP-binding protein [Planctomycetota bacterium]